MPVKEELCFQEGCKQEGEWEHIIDFYNQISVKIWNYDNSFCAIEKLIPAVIIGMTKILFWFQCLKG